LKTISAIGSHKNILNLIGACTNGDGKDNLWDTNELSISTTAKVLPCSQYRNYHSKSFDVLDSPRQKKFYFSENLHGEDNIINILKFVVYTTQFYYRKLSIRKPGSSSVQ
jgi:hypothetical protein